ncbi:MAG: hydrolase [Sulfobacillus acidophilus]|uniref:Hydrolase n=1 Tax=Sulfobacillus acidophilus TaxID=53633 RepID=A0A2T2WF63_9FIRM|nr:MAG: hydrolase [Sulfobacillus acidophilus]
MQGYRRRDGRVGIRNQVLVAYTVECARFVAETIVQRTVGTELVGFAGCYSDPYAYRMLVELGCHPNVAAVLVVSLGCESTDVAQLADDIGQSGKPVQVIVIQELGGTRTTIEKGCAIAQAMVADSRELKLDAFAWSELVVGVECGGSDATSGFSANPATGWAVDRLIEHGAAVIFSELPELLGTDPYLLRRARTPQIGDAILSGLERARKLGEALGQFAISRGNEAGGLTTIEEKSLGALAKAGTKPIDGVLKTGDRPEGSGLYLLDKVGDVANRQLAHYEINDNDGLVSLIASGAQLLLFTTGRGSVVGSVVSPVIKICGNPQTVKRMGDDVDIDASVIVLGREGIPAVGQRVLACVEEVASGSQTRSEALGHREYSIPYKPGRACDLI